MCTTCRSVTPSHVCVTLARFCDFTSSSRRIRCFGPRNRRPSASKLFSPSVIFCQMVMDSHSAPREVGEGVRVAMTSSSRRPASVGGDCGWNRVSHGPEVAADCGLRAPVKRIAEHAMVMMKRTEDLDMASYSGFDESSRANAADPITTGDEAIKPKGGDSMWRQAGALLLVIGLGGCMNMDHGPDTGGCGPACSGHWGASPKQPPTVPGVQGAYGEKIPMAAPYSANPPAGAMAAAAMMSRSVPLSMVQMSGSGVMPASYQPGAGGLPAAVMPPGGLISPPGLPFAPGMPPPGTANVPPGMMPGGMMPGGMMPGGMMPGGMPGAMGGAMAAAMPPQGGHPGTMPGMAGPAMGPGGYAPGVVGALPPFMGVNPAGGAPRFLSQRT